MGGDRYDVVTVGAGPAGATAAVLLGKNGRRVGLIDSAASGRGESRAGWLSARGAALLNDLGIHSKTLLECPFRDITFYRADFSGTAKPAFADSPGYLIDRVELANALVTAAVELGADLIRGSPVSDVQLGESSVAVELADGRRLEGSLLLLASGCHSDLLDRVGLGEGTTTPPIWTAQVEAPLASRSAPKESRVGVVLGLDKAGSFGLCCLSKHGMLISISWLGRRDDAVRNLVHLCRQTAEHKILPVDLSGQAQSAKAVRIPAGAALDMETHVAKHTLAIGDAGGFVAAASNEGIYPAMWSARISAEVVETALESVHSQDALMTFDAAWRIQMADYLRCPHTDIQFLLPLIFTNQAMADRMGAAFFLGENI